MSSNKATLVVGRGQRVAAQFKSLCLSMLHGSMGCGKSWLTFRIMRHASDLYDHEIAKILYCYTAHQLLFTQMEREVANVTFYNGLPSETYLREFAENVRSGQHLLLILDDMQSSVLDSHRCVSRRNHGTVRYKALKRCVVTKTIPPRQPQPHYFLHLLHKRERKNVLEPRRYE